jgi:hypothetical protein
VWLAAARGVICHGPGPDSDLRFVLVRDWLGESAPMDRDDALRELAARYLAAHGPAAPEDLAAWSGIRLSDARRSWKAIGDRMEEVKTSRGPQWMLRRGIGEAPRSVIRLLPAFDPYLLGWRSRDLVLPPDREREIFPGGGLLRPAVIADGSVVGGWKVDRKTTAPRVTIRPFGTLRPAARRGTLAEAEDVGRFYGLRAEAAFA